MTIKKKKDEDRTVWTVDENLTIHMHPDLKNMLGFSRVDDIEEKHEEQVRYDIVADLYRNFRRIYLLSPNIICSSVVNNTISPILCSVPVDHTEVDTIFSTVKPVYHKLNSSRIEEIHIFACDEKGRQLTSFYGTAYCLLHIKSIDIK